MEKTGLAIFSVLRSLNVVALTRRRTLQTANWVFAASAEFLVAASVQKVKVIHVTTANQALLQIPMELAQVSIGKSGVLSSYLQAL
jgi:hypothetical protein